MKGILLRYKYPFMLLIFTFLIHLNWFDFYNILTYSDWYYWPNEAARQLSSSYGSWVNFWNFGYINIQLQFNVFNFLWALLTNIGLSNDQAVKITFLFPIAILGFLSPYFLSKKLFKDDLISFTTAIFYGTTTHFLIRQTSHLTVALIYSIAPLIFLLFIYSLEKNKLSNWILFSLVYSIAVGYETRIMYIVTFILFIYFLFFYTRRLNNFYKNIILVILIIILLNLFWILPIFLGRGFSDASVAFNRGLFGNNLFSLTKSFTIFEASWTGAYPNMFFIPQTIKWYFWTFPIIAFFACIALTRDYKKEVLFFSFIALIGILITKQSAPPLPSFYQWMYSNFPGFNMFREASKFYLITSIGYLGLIGYSLVKLKKMKTIFYFVVFVLIFFSIINAKPLLTGEIGTMFVPREIPQDYLVLKDYVLEQHDYFRTLWVPTSSRWSIYTNNRPKAGTVELIQTDWKNYMNSESKIYNLPFNKQITYIFKQNFSNNLLDVSAIKYVIIPIQDIYNDNDFFIYYGKRDYFINEIEKIDYLNKIDIGAKNLILFENKDYLSHIYISTFNQTLENLNKNEIININYEFVNPTEYRIKSNLDKPFYLYFSEGYHPDWKLIQNFMWYKDLNKGDYIFDKTHFKAYGFLNGWHIDPSELTKNEKGYYELTLYFRPQSYFFTGLIISGFTFIACLVCLFWYWRKERTDKRSTEDLL